MALGATFIITGRDTDKLTSAISTLGPDASQFQVDVSTAMSPVQYQKRVCLLHLSALAMPDRLHEQQIH